jgi:ArsR family transcriptional regulator
MLEEHVHTVSDLLKSLSHPLRLRILCLLQEGEKSVKDIQEVVHTTTGNISQHLNILRRQGIVESRRDANFVYNRIGDPRVLELVNKLQTLFCGESAATNAETRRTP